MSQITTKPWNYKYGIESGGSGQDATQEFKTNDVGLSRRADSIAKMETSLRNLENGVSNNALDKRSNKEINKQKQNLELEAKFDSYIDSQLELAKVKYPQLENASNLANFKKLLESKAIDKNEEFKDIDLDYKYSSESRATKMEDLNDPKTVESNNYKDAIAGLKAKLAEVRGKYTSVERVHDGDLKNSLSESRAQEESYKQFDDLESLEKNESRRLELAKGNEKVDQALRVLQKYQGEKDIVFSPGENYGSSFVDRGVSKKVQELNKLNNESSSSASIARDKIELLGIEKKKLGILGFKRKKEIEIELSTLSEQIESNQDKFSKAKEIYNSYEQDSGIKIKEISEAFGSIPEEYKDKVYGSKLNIAELMKIIVTKKDEYRYSQPNPRLSIARNRMDVIKNTGINEDKIRSQMRLVN